MENSGVDFKVLERHGQLLKVITLLPSLSSCSECNTLDVQGHLSATCVCLDVRALMPVMDPVNQRPLKITSALAKAMILDLELIWCGTKACTHSGIFWIWFPKGGSGSLMSRRSLSLTANSQQA